MILAYEFEYVSKNLVLENFLKIISLKFGVNHKICRDKNITTLFVQEEEDKQHKFADYLSSNLPKSIFLKSSNAKIALSIEGKEVNIKNTAISLPFTKRAIDAAKNEKSFYFNAPFVPNEVGYLNTTKNIPLSLECKDGLILANDSIAYEKIYKKIATVIKNGDKVKIKTPNGNFIFFKVDKKSLKEVQNFEVIPTNLSLVQKMVNLRENELEALVSLEKPIIRAKVNMVFESFNILPAKRVKIRMPNTIYLELICEKLYEMGVEFIAKSSGKLEYSCFLNYKIDIPKIPDIEVSILENNEIFILNSDKYSENSLKKDLNKFKEPSMRQFVSILRERNLFDDKTSCFYFSKKYNDAVLYHDEDKGMLQFMQIPMIHSVRDIFNAIKSEDENGKKLVENFKTTYPKLFLDAQRAKIPKKISSNLFNVISFISLIIGFSKDFKNAGEKLIENAEDFGGQKGPRVDFRLINEEKIHSDFNIYKLIRSAISFKLAGADDMTLSFGILESFSYFISDIADAHKETLGSDKIALGGSFFSYPLIAQLVAKNLLPNHKIYFNQELPIDNL